MPFFRQHDLKRIPTISDKPLGGPAKVEDHFTAKTTTQARSGAAARSGCFLLTCVCLIVQSHSVEAQSDSIGETTVKVTLQQIDTARALVESSASLDDAAKTAAKQSLDQSSLDLQSADAAIAEAAEMQKAIDEVEQSRESIRLQIEAPAEESPKFDGNQPLATLQQALVKHQTELAEAEEAMADAAAESSRRQSRLLAIPDERTAATERLEEVQKKLELLPSDAKASAVSEASRLQLRAAKMLLDATLKKLSIEQAYYVTTNDILPLQRQLAEQRVDDYRQRVAEVNAAINNYRRDEISELRHEIESSIDASPEAQETLDRLDEYEKISSRMAVISKERQEVTRWLEEVKTREKTMTDRVEAVGLTEALALLLQNEKTRLQNIRRQFQPDTQVRSEIRDLQILTFKLEDQALEGFEPSDRSTASLAVQEDATSNEQLVINRRRVLQKTAAAGSALFQELVSLDTSQRQLREAIDRYLIFIEEKLLWTRNAPSITATPPSDAAKGLIWLFSLDKWRLVPGEWIRDLRGAPVRCSIFAILVIVLFLGASRWRHAIDEASLIASKRNCVELKPTLHATAATLLVAAPIPLALMGIGWVGADSQISDDFLNSLGHGFLVAAGLLAPVLFLREICRVNGLGEVHFGWPSAICERIRKACDTAAVFATPIVLAASTLRSQTDDTIANSAGRYCVLAFLVLMILILHRLLLPSRFWSSFANKSLTWYRLRRLVYFIAIAIPITLMILMCSGYSYISNAIATRLLYSSAILLFVVLVESIALRATMLRQRKLSIQQWQQQRQQLSEKSTEGDAALALGAEVHADVDLTSVSQQAKQLIRLIAIVTGTSLVWMIWSDLLPALAMLDRVTLWVVGQGADTTDVTLGDLLFTIVTISLTVFALKNLPAVIELTLLQNLPINPGARYAISTIFRYVLGTVGVLIGLRFLSIPWSQLSWILAAASVGLGFGLQEIVANFVSGIILLLEQPIRVGDIVTVDGTTGVVTKMQIRATTVTNWDRQELIIPNKDLITGKLLNWTLSNVINRIVIEVGVAYGTDVDAAHKLIMDAATSHAEVMNDPPPIVTFSQFGDSALNFVLRCYLPSLEKRLQTTHELHAAIARSLDQAGIVIPFPQRDVNFTLTNDPSQMAEIRDAIRSINPPKGGQN